MNEHLESVFKILLPKLEKSEIDYWVYGGIGIAAYVNKFIRTNEDVDIFVRNDDFEKTRLELSESCKQNKFSLKYCIDTKNGRPKVDIKINSSKVLSVIPVYPKDSIVEFKYPTGNELYSNEILEKVERNISGYIFFTPRNEFIKELFENHIKAKPGKKKREKYQIDAKAILSVEELSEQGWRID